MAASQTRPDPDLPALTTMHVQRAIDGNGDSLGWLISHLAPLLHAQANYRLGRTLRRDVDPEDLVNGAWVVAMPRLHRLQERDGRWTPVLLKYLSTTMRLQIQNLRRRQQTRQANTQPSTTSVEQDPPAQTAGVATRVNSAEVNHRVRRCIEALRPADREIVVLRGIEQHDSGRIAKALGISVDAVYTRYSRALQRLRHALPRSIFDELDAE